jgi:hypothetical protein
MVHIQRTIYFAGAPRIEPEPPDTIQDNNNDHATPRMEPEPDRLRLLDDAGPTPGRRNQLGTRAVTRASERDTAAAASRRSRHRDSLL